MVLSLLETLFGKTPACLCAISNPYAKTFLRDVQPFLPGVRRPSGRPQDLPRQSLLCISLPPLHLTALGDGNVHVWDVLATVARLGVLHLLDDVEAVHNLAEDDVLAVKEGRWHGGDEKLGSVGVGSRVLSLLRQWCLQN